MPQKLLADLLKVSIFIRFSIGIRIKINKKPDTFHPFTHVLQLYFVSKGKITCIPQTRYYITLGRQFIINGPAPDLTKW